MKPNSDTNDLRHDYLQILENWIPSAKQDIHVPPERPDLECYGSGFNQWGTQTTQKAFAAFAVVATDPDLNEKRIGMSREAILDHALKLLRFSLASHVSGDYHCLDGESWGNTWISALGVERMMHAVDELTPYMNDEDKDAVRRVLLSECDWLTDGYFRADSNDGGKIKAGLTRNNDPESNLWNGSMLLRTAMMYPDAPKAQSYIEQGTKFVLNGISIEADSQSETIYSGRPLSEWHVGANFFPSYALNHHGYMNVGYMVICLSQVAMAHFAWKKRGLVVPEAFYLHARDLWKVVKTMTFPDGRLARIGGDTRARYCYCQDYAVPTWVFAEDQFGDENCVDFERSWLDILRQEIVSGDNAGFLVSRLTPMRELSPTYYTRLESDRAAALSMALCWRRNSWGTLDSAKYDEKEKVKTHWSDEYHGSCMTRGEKRLASFTWRSAEAPQGLCVPLDRSDMAEWQYNLSARIIGTGAKNRNEVRTHGHDSFDDGFVNYGVCDMITENNLAEGESNKIIAKQQIAFAALPDDSTVIGVQFATAVNRCFARNVKGLHYLMPNDIFNESSRVYRTEKNKIELSGPSLEPQVVELESTWVNIDDSLTISTLDRTSLRVHRPGKRQIEFCNKPLPVSSLHADEICTTYRSGIHSYDNGEIIIDTAYTIRVDESHEEAASRLSNCDCGYINDNRNVRVAYTTGRNGVEYALILNLLDRDLTLSRSELPQSFQEKEIELKAYSAILLNSTRDS